MGAEEENLISAGASMLRAASDGDADAVRAALAAGAYVDQRGRGGHTALIVAAIFNHVDIARLLVAAGADVGLPDTLGLTAREWADRRGSSDVAQLLLEASTVEVVASEKASSTSGLRKGNAERANPEVETNITLEQLPLRMTKAQSSTTVEPQSNSIESEPLEAQRQPASAAEARRARQDDAQRFLKLHQRIMADQSRREAEQQLQTSSESSAQASPIEKNIPPLPSAHGLAYEEEIIEPDPERREADVATSPSERGAVATWSSMENLPTEADNASPSQSEQGAVPTWPSAGSTTRKADDVATSPSEHEAVATWSSTESPTGEEDEAVRTSPSQTNISLSLPHGALSIADEQGFSIPVPHRGEVDEVAAFLSELEAMETVEPTHREIEEVDSSVVEAEITTERGAPAGTEEPHSTTVNPQSLEADENVSSWSEQLAEPFLSEPGADRGPNSGSPRGVVVATASPKDAMLSSEPAESSTTTTARPAEAEPRTAQQLARIAATIEHLRIFDESPEKSEGPTRAAAELVGDELDATVERLRANPPAKPAAVESEPAQPLNPPPIKRCPKCNAGYGNPLLMYCAFDATKLVKVNDSLSGNSAANDRSWQTLAALVVIVAVLGASLGYLINNYRSRERVSTAPAPIAASKIEHPLETPRKDLPLIEGAISGMEVDVPQPAYPEQARAEGVSGTVTVRVRVDGKGRVVLARSSGGDSRLRAAAVEAAQRAIFSPEKLAAHGKVVSGTITYEFALQTESPAPAESPSPQQTDSPPAMGASSATGSSAENADGDYPVVGGQLVGAESNLPQPDYPELAKSKGISGTITVVVRVNRTGKVISWRTLEGDSRLRAAALKAAKKATFSPGKLPGKDDVVGTITYNFKP